MLARNLPHPDFPYTRLFYVLAMKQKYYAFAVQSSKVMIDRTGIARHRDILLYGTQIFTDKKACDSTYSDWRCEHPLKLSTIVEFDRKPKIDPLTREFLGFYPDEEEQAQ